MILYYLIPCNFHITISLGWASRWAGDVYCGLWPTLALPWCRHWSAVIFILFCVSYWLYSVNIRLIVSFSPAGKLCWTLFFIHKLVLCIRFLIYLLPCNRVSYFFNFKATCMFIFLFCSVFDIVFSIFCPVLVNRYFRFDF